MSVLVGRKMPYFNAHANINGEDMEVNFSLDQYIGEKHVVFFFYPKDYLNNRNKNKSETTFKTPFRSQSK